MESKTSSGQILIECAILLLFLAILFASLLDFNAPKKKSSKQQVINNKQVLDLRQYRNGDRR